MTNNITTISLRAENRVVSMVLILLQRRFGIQAKTGCCIREFLAEECGIDEGYIIEKIKTIFLNSKPVDNIDTALIRNGSTLALSGAMPGLVGALMRTGSIYSSLRSPITYREEDYSRPVEHTGMVGLKLFNLVLQDLGPGFLHRGIFMQTPDISSFLQDQTGEFWSGCREILYNNSPVKAQILIESLEPYGDLNEQVFVSVRGER
ncbi:MAG: hypothetical protein GY754_17100 [bacterium]|nr:hypothetical protein [bacterium]